MTDVSIAWIHRLGPQAASYRYRAEMPAREVAKLNGFRCSLNEGTAGVLVFAKPLAPDLALAETAKAAGAKIVVDLADDHLTKKGVGSLYAAMAKLADAVVCPTAEMASRVHAVTGVLPHAVIPDPYEMPEVAPHAEGGNALWFGISSGLHDLDEIRGALKKFDLRVVTGPKVPEGAIQWTQDVLLRELMRANVVVIPTRQGAEYKTNNRLLNAIRGGTFPVVSMHPAHMEFRRFVWVGVIPTGLQWVRAFQSDLNALVAAAQDHIRVRYSPETIGAQWADFLGAL